MGKNQQASLSPTRWWISVPTSAMHLHVPLIFVSDKHAIHAGLVQPLCHIYAHMHYLWMMDCSSGSIVSFPAHTASIGQSSSDAFSILSPTFPPMYSLDTMKMSSHLEIWTTASWCLGGQPLILLVLGPSEGLSWCECSVPYSHTSLHSIDFCLFLHHTCLYSSQLYSYLAS